MQIAKTGEQAPVTLLSRLGPPLKRGREQLTPDNPNTDSASSSTQALKQPKLQQHSASEHAAASDDKMVPSSSREAHSKVTTSTRGRVGSPLSRGRPLQASSRSQRPGRGRLDSKSKRTTGERDKTINALKSTLPEPLMDIAYIESAFEEEEGKDSNSDISGEWRVNPKSALSNFMMQAFGRLPQYETKEGLLRGRKIFR